MSDRQPIMEHPTIHNRPIGPPEINSIDFIELAPKRKLFGCSRNCGATISAAILADLVLFITLGDSEGYTDLSRSKLATFLTLEAQELNKRPSELFSFTDSLDASLVNSLLSSSSNETRKNRWLQR
jgi:hypothetical protein